MWTVSLGSILFASANVQKSVKSLKVEDFKNSETKSSKIKNSEGKTLKTKTSEGGGGMENM